MNDRIAPRNLASLVGWLLVGFAGAGAIAILAISRGETVNALWMVVASVCVFAIAYRFHSAWLMARVLTLNELRATPARIHEREWKRTKAANA
jgi:carbon starvation protein